MNGIPLRFDYSKTLNEQLPTFEYYKDRYCSYELEIMRLRNNIRRALHRIQLLQMDGEVAVSDLGYIVRELRGDESGR